MAGRAAEALGTRCGSPSPLVPHRPNTVGFGEARARAMGESQSDRAWPPRFCLSRTLFLLSTLRGTSVPQPSHFYFTSREVTHPSATLAQARLTAQFLDSHGFRGVAPRFRQDHPSSGCSPRAPTSAGAPRGARRHKAPRLGSTAAICGRFEGLRGRGGRKGCRIRFHGPRRGGPGEEQKGVQHEDFPGGHPS